MEIDREIAFDTKVKNLQQEKCTGTLLKMGTMMLKNRKKEIFVQGKSNIINCKNASVDSGHSTLQLTATSF